MFVFALGSTAHAALYLWNGSAGDGNWDTALNWTVTDSAWTWPNEELAADPNNSSYVNTDVLGIDILNGDAVNRAGALRLRSPDASTTAVLTLNNASSLTVNGRLATIGDGLRGQIDVLGGSTLTVVKTDAGDNLNVADDDNSWGTLNVVDSTVTVADDIKIDQGEGHINISGSSTINCDDTNVCSNATAVGYIDISGTTVFNGTDDLETGDGEGHITISGDVVVTLADDLKTSNGEGHINIGGNSTINCDDIIIADGATGVGYLDISGTATLTAVDDFKVDEGIGIITIGGDAVITFGDDCYLPDQTPGNGTMTLTGNSVFNVGDDMTIADDAGTVGHVIVTGNATLNAPDELYLADDPTAFATLDVNGTATVNIGDDLNIGEDGPGICNIGENAVVTVADDIYVAHNVAKGAFESHMTISGNATVNVDDFIVANNGGLTGYLEISGNPTINCGDDFTMNDDADSAPSYSQVIMNGGTVFASDLKMNDENNGTAEFIMNGGSFYCTGYLAVSDNLDGTAHLTMNGGQIITADRLRLGKDGGVDTGQVRIFMNGGLLQAKELSDIKITDTQIIYTGGLFAIGSASLSKDGMQQLITDGTIVVNVADGVYSIATTGDGYTVLNPVAPLLPKIPNPADGAEGVLLGTTLSWGAGDTAATHDVYFGTSSPPALIGNQEAAAYYPGPIELGTTYYWQIVEVEADGTTKHASDIWSFTTTTDLSTVSEIATQPDPADGTDGVSIEGTTLSWWPGASAVSHDVYFGNTSPPALAGNQVEMSFDSGSLKPSTTYYWQVDAVEADGTTKHTGDIWSFTTESGNATEPDPADGATEVPKMVTLSWMPGLTAASHDVYFSADQQAVIDGTAPVTNVTETSFSTEMLDKGKTYYWRVDAVEADGTTKYTGDVWSFTVTTAGR